MAQDGRGRQYEISLLRHGRSRCDLWSRLSCDEFREWLGRYRDLGIRYGDTPPRSACRAAAAAQRVLCSDLPRAVESATQLAPDVSLIRESLFREVDLPALPWRSRMRLSPLAWVFVSRIRWLCGYTSGAESLAEARRRARAATGVLVRHAEETGNILLVGHAFFNLLIARELRAAGWRGPPLPRHAHWCGATYRRDF